MNEQSAAGWRAWGDGFGALRRILLLAFLVLASWASPATSDEFRAKTELALATLKQSVEYAQAGSPAESERVLSQAGKAIEELSQASVELRKKAEKSHDLCLAKVVDFDMRIGSMDQQTRNLEIERQSAESRLAGAKVRQDELRGEIDRLEWELRGLEAQLREAEAKNRELSTWFWVPGYGQYLLVRGLIDEISGKYRKARNSYMDRLHELDYVVAHLKIEERGIQDLFARQAELRSQKERLESEREQVRQESERIRRITVFYNESAFFWQRVEGLLGISIAGQKDNLLTLYASLDSDDSAILKDVVDESAGNMRQALLELAARLDKGNDFIGKDLPALCTN